MSNTQQVQIPAFPDVSQETLARLANAEPVLIDGDFRAIIPKNGAAVFVGKKDTNKGQVYYSVTLIPLSNHKDPRSVVNALRTSYLITSPFESAGQTVPPPGRAASDLVTFMHALFPDEVPAYPTKAEGLPKGTYKYRAKTVSGDAETRAAKTEALGFAEAKLRLLHGNLNAFENVAVDMRVRTSAKGNKYMNFYPETALPSDWGYGTPRAE